MQNVLSWLGLLLPMAFATPSCWGLEHPIPEDKFGIHVVDEQGRGVPLVELTTVNGIRCVTDNAGWIAWDEPGLMNREVFWHVSGPGIERKADGFGYRGFRAVTQPGTSVVCEVSTTNIATRIGRLTGQGLYRDSELLGQPCPVPNLISPGVTGQDSVQAVPFQGQLFWLWGDTNRENYPLGNFNTTCATSPQMVNPETGIQFEYFTDQENPSRLRRMMPSEDPGVVWMFGLFSFKDPSQTEHLFAGFSRRPGLAPPFEQGIAEFDVNAGHFRKVASAPLETDRMMPHGNAVRVTTPNEDYFYFCHPFAQVRVLADLETISNSRRYEALHWDKSSQTWRWEAKATPTTQADEAKLIQSGDLPAEQARYQIHDAATGQPVSIHGADIAWNDFRQRYILLGLQLADNKAAPSLLGEIWYAECDSIAGPWTNAMKVASHPKYSFYNPRLHRFFNRNGGRTVYFEGTYTKQFSGNDNPTPRYDYNQILYRLDLDDPRLKPAQ